MKTFHTYNLDKAKKINAFTKEPRNNTLLSLTSARLATVGWLRRRVIATASRVVKVIAIAVSSWAVLRPALTWAARLASARAVGTALVGVALGHF